MKYLTPAIATLVALLWIFSGWPQLSSNPDIPPQPQVASADTTSTYYTGTATEVVTNKCSWENIGNATGDTTDTATTCDLGGNGSFTSVLSATNFGFTSTDIPADSTIDGVTVEVEWLTQDTSVSDDTVQLTTDGSNGVGDNKAGNLSQTTKTIQTYGGSADGWGAGLTQADVTSANFGVILRYIKDTGGPPQLVSVYRVRVTVEYTPPNQPPNAPSQDAPTDGATDVSKTPNFLMTTTDPDGDNLGYKTTIYSDSGCSTVVQTHDQSVDSTGWAGTDATCTNSPTSCYTSGTQGDFTVQSGDALTAGTQYWWEASALDPDGSGTFTDSGLCYSFTTAATISITVSDGSIDYGGVQAGNTNDTISLGDTQTVTNTGDVTIDLNIVGQDTACPWTLAATAGTDQYVHEFSTDSGGVWTALTTTNQTLATGIAAAGTQDFDLQLTSPTDSSCDTEQSVDVTVQAVQQ
ncbi:MAG: hypothetical protein WD335_03215 [Candidatus Paceibacterota bacterium]